MACTSRNYDHQEMEKSGIEHLRVIIEDIFKTSKIPVLDWLKMSKIPFRPLAIPISIGKEYRVSQLGVDAAYELTDHTWKRRKELKEKMVKKTFDGLSFQAIGRAIETTSNHHVEAVNNSKISGEIDTDVYQQMAQEYRDCLDGLIDQVCLDFDQHIPCTLFHEDQMVPSFSVGPVVFRPRKDWIECFVKDQETKSIVHKLEQGELKIEKVQQRSFEPDCGRPIRDALTITNLLKGFSWVGTIRSEGHELVWSQRKMSTIVDLAIDLVGTRFDANRARRFTSASRAHLYVEDRLATSVADGHLFHSVRMNVPGLGARPGELAKTMSDAKEFLSNAGRIMCLYLKSREEGSVHPLVERWLNALYWIGQGRLEVSDFKAVVNFGCALDLISKGGGDLKAITNFVEAALKPRENEEEITEDKMSVAKAVKEVYLEGRSKLLHGNRPGVLEDFSEARGVGDFLLVHLFDRVTAAIVMLLIDGSSKMLKRKNKELFRLLKGQLIKAN